MRIATISRGGQVSIPAEIRHRWGVRRVVIVERGNVLEIRPLPDDPIAALRGSLRGSGVTTDQLREEMHEEEAEAEERKFGHLRP
jgi:bifunctional DNA-binding transcriptional regulator/antitoxin component of YhaV-PrlF toxin-antitoxin module